MFNRHATTRSSRYAFGSGSDLPLARLVALALLAVPVVAVWLIVNTLQHPAPSKAGEALANFNPRSLLGGEEKHFLPTPVAVIPAERNAGPPAPAQQEDTAARTTSVENVKVANTGGIGAVLRSDPPRGRPVGSLRDGQTLQVLEHKEVNGDEWLHVRTEDGKEGWVYGRLVVPLS